MMANTGIICAFVVVVALAAGFAGAETGIYRLSPLRLRLGAHSRRLRYAILTRVAADRPSLLLSTLVGTNLAHYLATGLITIMLLKTVAEEHTAELLATVIAAPVLLVFSELIPKTIFYYRADSLMPLFSPFLLVFYRLFQYCGVLALLKGCCRLFAGLAPPAAAGTMPLSDMRSFHIPTILHETRQEAFLSPVQMLIISRITDIASTRIGSVMTPLSRVESLDRTCDTAAVLAKLGTCPYTRLAVVEGNRENIIGFVDIYECLTAGVGFSDLDAFVRPIAEMSDQVTVSQAIDTMQRENRSIVLVTRRGRADSHKPLGIVTMKDLVEEILGELTEW